MPSLNSIKRRLHWKYRNQKITFQEMIDLETEELENKLNKSFNDVLHKIKLLMYHKPSTVKPPKFQSTPGPIPNESKKWEYWND